MEVLTNDLLVRFVLHLPPEEFSSFDRLFYHIELAYYYAIDNDLLAPSWQLEAFAEHLFNSSCLFQPCRSQFPLLWKHFQSFLNKIPKCGAIMIDPSGSECLLIQGVHSSRWGFPKGKIDQNESLAACAIREVLEEIGFDCSPLLDETAVLTQRNLTLFVVCNVPKNTSFQPEPTEVKQVRWFKLADLPKNGRNGKAQNFTTATLSVIPRLLSLLPKRSKKQTKKKKKPSWAVKSEIPAPVLEESKVCKPTEPLPSLLSSPADFALAQQPKQLLQPTQQPWQQPAQQSWQSLEPQWESRLPPAQQQRSKHQTERSFKRSHRGPYYDSETFGSNARGFSFQELLEANRRIQEQQEQQQQQSQLNPVLQSLFSSFPVNK